MSTSSALAPSAPSALTLAPQTGIGGNNPGNANTGGVQVQSVNVMQDTNAVNSRSDLLRRERLRAELENESRVLEKVEQGRLEDESLRAKTIEGFKSSVSGGNKDDEKNQDAPLSSVPVQAPLTLPAQTGALPVETSSAVTVSVRSARPSFMLTPFAGYRWTVNERSEFDVQNRGMAGVMFGGALSRYLAIEGAFSYSRDQFASRTVQAYPMQYQYGPGYYNQNGYYNYGYNNGYYGGYDSFRARNTFDLSAGVKLGVPVQMVTPFVVGRLGGQLNKYEIDNSFTTAQAQNIGWSRSSTHTTGVVGGGLDVAVGRDVDFGGRWEYMSILNRRYNEMDRIYGDSRDRSMVSANLTIRF
jgi:hypothetical protein